MNYFDSEVINFDCLRFWCSLDSFRVMQKLFSRYKSEISVEFRDLEMNTVLSTKYIAHCTSNHLFFRVSIMVLAKIMDAYALINSCIKLIRATASTNHIFFHSVRFSSWCRRERWMMHFCSSNEIVWIIIENEYNSRTGSIIVAYDLFAILFCIK